jgi:hypothetical protein
MRAIRNALRLGVAAALTAGTLAVVAAPAHAIPTNCGGGPHYLTDSVGHNIGAFMMCTGGSGTFQVWVACTDRPIRTGNIARVRPPYPAVSTVACEAGKYAYAKGVHMWN